MKHTDICTNCGKTRGNHYSFIGGAPDTITACPNKNGTNPVPFGVNGYFTMDKRDELPPTLRNPQNVMEQDIPDWKRFRDVNRASDECACGNGTKRATCNLHR